MKTQIASSSVVLVNAITADWFDIFDMKTQSASSSVVLVNAVSADWFIFDMKTKNASFDMNT